MGSNNGNGRDCYYQVLTMRFCVQRVLLWERRNNIVPPFKETVQQMAARVSALRDAYDGPQFDDQGTPPVMPTSRRLGVACVQTLTCCWKTILMSTQCLHRSASLCTLAAAALPFTEGMTILLLFTARHENPVAAACAQAWPTPTRARLLCRLMATGT